MLACAANRQMPAGGSVKSALSWLGSQEGVVASLTMMICGVVMVLLAPLLAVWLD